MHIQALFLTYLLLCGASSFSQETQLPVQTQSDCSSVSKSLARGALQVVVEPFYYSNFIVYKTIEEIDQFLQASNDRDFVEHFDEQPKSSQAAFELGTRAARVSLAFALIFVLENNEFVLKCARSAPIAMLMYLAAALILIQLLKTAENVFYLMPKPLDFIQSLLNLDGQGAMERLKSMQNGIIDSLTWAPRTILPPFKAGLESINGILQQAILKMDDESFLIQATSLSGYVLVQALLLRLLLTMSKVQSFQSIFDGNASLRQIMLCSLGTYPALMSALRTKDFLDNLFHAVLSWLSE